MTAKSEIHSEEHFAPNLAVVMLVCRPKLVSAEFEVLRRHNYNFISHFFWLLDLYLLKGHRFDQQAVRLFERVIFPPMHGFESHIGPPPIVQSLPATARAK